MEGTWTPNYEDTGAGRVPGFGATTMVINGGIECGKGETTQSANRQVETRGKFQDIMAMALYSTPPHRPPITIPCQNLISNFVWSLARVWIYFHKLFKSYTHTKIIQGLLDFLHLSLKIEYLIIYNDGGSHGFGEHFLT